VTRVLCRVTHDHAPRGSRPEPAIFVSNFVSFLDPFILRIVCGRSLRVMIPSSVAGDRRLGKYYAKIGAITVPVGQGAGVMRKIYREAESAIARGESVCIFPEGQMSRTGMMLPFRRGLEIIASRTNRPVIPVHIDLPTPLPIGTTSEIAWRHILWKAPHRFSVTIGKPMPPGVNTPAVRQAIQILGARAFGRRSALHGTVVETVIATAKRRWSAESMADTVGRQVNFGRLLTGGVLMSRWLEPQVDSKYVGVLMPSTVAGAIANLAISLTGRIPVNLNFTAAREGIDHAIHLCGIRHVVTSRAFLQKYPVEMDATFIHLEDMRKTLPKWKPAVAFIALRLLPSKLISRLFYRGKRDPEETAAVLFSSGSTGLPKGVMLSHRNLLANIESVRQCLELNERDCIVGILPLFHAFGLTVTMWLPMALGLRAAYHTSPLDAKVIGELVNEHEATILVSTPAFCSRYVSRVPEEHFSTLRIAFVGAEKLKDSLINAFESKYGVPLCEGYGATECSPIISGNLPNFRAGRDFQRSQKHGSVGQPIPGIAARIVHPETREDIAPGGEGLLLIKGANVMKGYLKDPERTAEVLVDDWYVTGDIARLDRDGFITITGRQSRFSKIGGEMVPHGRIEEIIQNYTKEPEPVIGVFLCFPRAS
jgi:acyl-[acyl-carrier-protein]-phospholipid O-acyltransferase/long-chain-fatty-acid--[acyl-carrier-protein] ligase